MQTIQKNFWKLISSGSKQNKFNQKKFCLVQNQSENGKYNQVPVNLTRIRTNFSVGRWHCSGLTGRALRWQEWQEVREHQDKTSTGDFIPYLVRANLTIVHGPDDFRWTFLLRKAAHDFSIKHNLKFKKIGGALFWASFFSSRAI